MKIVSGAGHKDTPRIRCAECSGPHETSTRTGRPLCWKCYDAFTARTGQGHWADVVVQAMLTGMTKQQALDKVHKLKGGKHD